ncbi:sensor histidine kinase [Streptomyces sp. NPDC006326]|uniref:sensor histidine kinase n=1 Tax=Streptomyces sp. NPDC006326 TaxID=3156752 RepID=UPI00339EB678
MDTTSRRSADGRTPLRWQTVGLWAGAGLVTLALSNLALRVPLGFGDRIFEVGPLLAVLGLALAAALVRRAPLLTLGLMLLGIHLLLFLANAPALTPALVLPAAVALGLLAADRPRRTALTAVALTVLALLVAQFARPGPDTVPVLMQAQLPIVVLGWLIGDSVRRGRESAAQAHARATEQALTEERLRIARELHDMVAHSIGIIAIQAGVGSRVIDTRPAQAREALQAIEATSRETLSGLRRTLVALRRSEPAPLAPAPGLDGLDRLASTTSADAGVRVELVWSGDRRPLPPDIELAAFRIVQEALTNVVRHARAAHCRVAVAYGPQELSLEVTDDGRGTSGGGGGFGITGMRERTALLHGSFEAGPGPGGGFRVAAVLPLEPDQERGPVQAVQAVQPGQPVVSPQEEK